MGRPRIVWHQSRIAALIRMRTAGMPWRAIGDALNVPHPSCARYWREVLKLPGGKVPPHRRRTFPRKR